MQKIKALLFATLLAFVAVNTIPQRAYAAVDPACKKNTILGLPTWYEYLNVTKDSVGDGCSIVGPPGNSSKPDVDWSVAIGYVAIAILEILLRLASLIAVGYVIYGGFKFITAQGEPENAKAARETVQNAVIGLVIAVVAASAVNFVASRLMS